MSRSSKIWTVPMLLAAASLAVLPAWGSSAEALFPGVAKALETGDRARLMDLFPSDRKVTVSLRKIADLEGFTGSGPLVEALRRYIVRKDDVRFERDPSCKAREGAASVRVRGTLISKDKAGRRERVTLLFVFERVAGSWLATEVRETG